MPFGIAGVSRSAVDAAQDRAAQREARLFSGGVPGGPFYNPGLAGISTMNSLNDIVAGQWANSPNSGAGALAQSNLASRGVDAGAALSLEAMRQSSQNQRLNAILPAILAAFSRTRQTPQLGQFLGGFGQQPPQPAMPEGPPTMPRLYRS